MSSSGLMEQDDLLRFALAQSQVAEFDDDDDEDFDDDDEMFEFDDDDDEEFDDDDEMFEFDDDDDEDIGMMDMADGFESDGEDFSERRRRRRRRRSFRRPRFRRFTRRPRMGKVKGSRSTTMRGRNGRRMRVRFGKSFATSAEVNKLIASTNKRFAAAMKERKANHDALSKRIASATKNLDGKVSSLRKSVKTLERQAQTSSLLGLLGGAPKAEKIKLSGAAAGALAGQEIDAEITFKKQDILLPILASGAFGKSGGTDDTLMYALLLGRN